MMVIAACSQDAEDTTTTEAETPATTAAVEETTTTSEAAPDTTETTEAMMEIVTGPGVTEEPCPGGNPDRGCIYLGVLTDESGPFAGAAPGLYAGQSLFWATVNAEGGIGGAYDVAVPENLKKDTGYQPEKLVADYNTIAEDVAAIAQSLGTPQTLAVLPDYERDSTVAAPMSWWSGWAFTDLVLEFGTNYCFEAMNAIDWAVSTGFPAAGRELATIGILEFPSDYGFDYAEGVKIAAEANGLTVSWEETVIPVSAGGDPAQVEAVAKIVGDAPDLVILVTGPSETAAIVGGAAQQLGANVPLFIGAAPSWNAALLDSAAAPAFESGIFFQSSFTAGWDYESTGHEKMRTAVTAAGFPPNDFFISGWVSQYGLKAALEAAYEAGDLSHEGIKNAALALTDVDYEGMMPARSFAGDPNDVFPREGTVGGYSADATTGIAVIQDFFVGPTAEGFEFTQACSQ
jgi:ABC-type branched-subunit amino acid transport system substrate-binding protein